jgi:hypothetical protein
VFFTIVRVSDDRRVIVSEPDDGQANVDHPDGGGNRVCRAPTRASLSRDFDEFHARRWFRHRLAFFLEAFDMKLDGAMNELYDSGPRLGDGHAAGQIGDVRPETFGAFFNDDCVSN